MVPGNFETQNLACSIGEDLPQAVQEHADWEWVNDGSEDKPKW